MLPAISQALQRIGMITGNALDVGASDAQIVQLAIVERSEFADGLLIGGPLFKRLTNTHLEVSLRLQVDI